VDPAAVRLAIQVSWFHSRLGSQSVLFYNIHQMKPTRWTVTMVWLLWQDVIYDAIIDSVHTLLQIIINSNSRCRYQ